VGRHPASGSMTLYDGYIKVKNNERKKEKGKIKKGKQEKNKMKEEKGGKPRHQLSRTYDLLRTTHQRSKIGAK
jgi:major membrane immunogen (membrane-anchored lipoprotein)